MNGDMGFGFFCDRYVFQYLGEKSPQDFGPIYCPKIHRALVEKFPPQTWMGEQWAPVDPAEVFESAYKFPQLKKGEAELDEESELEDGEIGHV